MLEDVVVGEGLGLRAVVERGAGVLGQCGLHVVVREGSAGGHGDALRRQLILHVSMGPSAADDGSDTHENQHDGCHAAQNTVDGAFHDRSLFLSIGLGGTDEKYITVRGSTTLCRSRCSCVFECSTFL
ncbi:hypothetical protein SDC9_184734 [bioreactor metagenome]|uniref:Uncharacterized protein n=1 Tax=bioreactor metagenome TaxID=1076179 RepID=A0A645HDV6_9ZZZZ